MADCLLLSFVLFIAIIGNNFAQGHYFYGPKYRDHFEEGLRKVVEHCESLQTFLVTHSLGGGTGSGVGTYMLSLLSDVFPKIYRFSTCVYPSVDNDVVTAPYNTILATRQLIDHADCVFPLDNTSMFSFAKMEEAALSKGKNKYGENAAAVDGRGGGGGGAAGTISSGKDHGFDAINGIAARMLCHLTSSSRFHGDMNVDMNEIYTNLVPYPQLHFLMTALSLREKVVRPTLARKSSAAIATSSTSSGKRMSLLEHQQRSSMKSVGGSGTSSFGGSSLGGGGEGERALLQRGFVDILGPRGQLSAAHPTQSKTCVTIASAFLARGSNVPLADFLGCVTSSKKSLRFPEWNEDACKIGICGTPTPGDHSTVLGVYNSTAFGTVLSRESTSFQRLFRVKAMLHHYTEFVEERTIYDAEKVSSSLISDYADLERQQQGQQRQQTSSERSPSNVGNDRRVRSSGVGTDNDGGTSGTRTGGGGRLETAHTGSTGTKPAAEWNYRTAQLFEAL